MGEDDEVGGERGRVGEGTLGAWNGILIGFEEDEELVTLQKMKRKFLFRQFTSKLQEERLSG